MIQKMDLPIQNIGMNNMEDNLDLQKQIDNLFEKTGYLMELYVKLQKDYEKLKNS